MTDNILDQVAQLIKETTDPMKQRKILSDLFSLGRLTQMADPLLGSAIYNEVKFFPTLFKDLSPGKGWTKKTAKTEWGDYEYSNNKFFAVVKNSGYKYYIIHHITNTVGGGLSRESLNKKIRKSDLIKYLNQYAIKKIALDRHLQVYLKM